MEINKLVKEVGLDMAVQLRWPDIPQDFLNKLSLKQWHEIYNEAPRGSDLQTFCIKKMLDKVKTFDDLHRLLCNIPAESHYGLVIFNKMAERASTLKHWQILFFEAPRAGALRERAAQRIVELAATFIDWENLYMNLPAKSKYREVALRGMENKADGFKDWLQLYYFAPKRSDLEIKIQQKIIDATQSCQEIHKLNGVYRCASRKNDARIKNAIQEKIAKLISALNFEQFCTLYSELEEEELKLIVLKKISKFITSFNEGLILYRHLKKDHFLFLRYDDMLNSVLQNAILALISDFGEVKTFEDEIGADTDPIEKLLLGKRVQLASNIKHWRIVYDRACRYEVYDRSGSGYGAEIAKLALETMTKLAEA